MRLLTFEPHRIDWWSTLIQLVGTLFFNVDTFRATQQSFYIFLRTFIGPRSSAAPTLEWKIVVVNLAGCILFGISAVAGYIVPETGDVLDLAAANVSTSLGALCFLIGSLLLLRETAEPTAPNPAPRPPKSLLERGERV